MVTDDNGRAFPLLLRDELADIHVMVMSLIELIQHQWDLVAAALQSVDDQSAIEIISTANRIQEYEFAIDHAVLTFLARENPVASDLRIALSFTKIAVVAEYLADESHEIAKLILSLCRFGLKRQDTGITEGILDAVQSIRALLVELNIGLRTWESSAARVLLEFENDVEKDIQALIHRRLLDIGQDSRHLKPILTTLQIAKYLESSSDHCKNLAEYCILLIDGRDVRHLPIA